jgi:hypothetical protein
MTMLEPLLNSVWLAFVLVTGLLLALLAICGVLVAGWSARDFFRTRRAGPVDWYDVTLPETVHRATGRKRISRPAGQPGQDAEIPVEKAYLQEELPF